MLIYKIQKQQDQSQNCMNVVKARRLWNAAMTGLGEKTSLTFKHKEKKNTAMELQD